MRASLAGDLLRADTYGDGWFNTTGHPDYRMLPLRDRNKLRAAAEEVLRELAEKASDKKEARTARVR